MTKTESSPTWLMKNVMKYSFNEQKHIHQIDEKPLIGTTTLVDSVVSKPLTYWASGMAVGTFGWLNPKKSTPEDRLERAKSALEAIKGLDVESYIELLDKAYKAHNEKKETSAEEGTDLHAEIEGFIRDFMSGNLGTAYPEQINGFVNWAMENVVEFLWAEASTYSEKYWLGGITDFGYKDKNDKVFIGDIKSSKEAYFSHFLQASLYALQLEETGGFTKEGERLFEPIQVDGFAIFPKGQNFQPSVRFMNDTWREGAEGAVKLYKLKLATE